jgi:hypothetical protein
VSHTSSHSSAVAAAVTADAVTSICVIWSPELESGNRADLVVARGPICPSVGVGGEKPVALDMLSTGTIATPGEGASYTGRS